MVDAGVATVSSLVQLRVKDNKVHRKHRCNNVKLTESGNAVKWQKRAATHDAYKAANQLTMAARRADYSKGLAVFRYENIRLVPCSAIYTMCTLHNQKMTDDIHSHRGWSLRCRLWKH